MSIAARDSDRVARLEARLERERCARREAEQLLEVKSRELYDANISLLTSAGQLELRVKERTEELIAAHQRAIDLVEHDHLTGLMSRGRFMRIGQEVIEDCRSRNGRAIFLMIDVDHFKDINDMFGHEAGDTVLKSVAGQLKALAEPQDVLARVGGDEFAMIVLDDDKTIATTRFADQVSRAMLAPISHRDKPIFAGASMGYAVFPDDGDTLDEVLRHADLALYASKSLGRGLCTGFDQKMREDLSAQLALEQNIRLAVVRRELEPWFQPIVNAHDCGAIGAEALVRWRKPDGSIVPPAAFLSAAESCGLMSSIFSIVLRASFEALRPLVMRGLLKYVSVNISPSQFRFDTLIGDVEAALAEFDFPPEALVLEITEEVLLTDFDLARSQMCELSRRGIRIALDDFGSGYANVGYLRRLPIHILKLDRSLTVDVVQDAKAMAIVQGVAGMAKSLDLVTVAEGIEVREQARALAEAGCQHQQGYLYARPMPAPEFAEYLMQSLWRQDLA